MPSVLIVSSGEDTGGVAAGIREASERLDFEWKVRCVRGVNNYINYPVDMEWAPGTLAQNPVVLRAYEQADVLHMFQKFKIAETFPGGTDKPRIIHHHGTIFRRNPEAFLEISRAEGIPGVVATLDLWLFAPNELEWVPAPYNLDRLARIRQEYLAPSDRLRIAHAPTQRRGKSTDAFLAACARLGKEIPIEIVLIERAPWQACLIAKSRADIYYDQVLVGYGNNAIEAWGMGIPVVAGASVSDAARVGIIINEGVLEEMQRRFVTLPFVNADEASIYDALRLLADEKQRQTYGEIGLSHVQRWHDGRETLAILKRVYERVA